jgi:hypothetical protein
LLRGVRKGRDMRTKSFFAAAVCAVAVMGAGAGAAFAGEVKGPPGDGTTQAGGNPNTTAAPEHSNSICSFNGLNDYDSLEGQNEFHVSTYGVDVAGKKVTSEPADPHEFNPGDACKGGSNPRNP